MTDQQEMQDIYKRHQINTKLENLISKEGLSSVVQKKQLSTILTTLKGDTREKGITLENQVILDNAKLKDDVKSLLSCYTIEVNKNKDLKRYVDQLESEKNVLYTKFSYVNEAAIYLDNLCTEIKDKHTIFKQMHNKCKITMNLNFVNKNQKLDFGSNQELDLYREYIEILSQCVNKSAIGSNSSASKIKHHYKLLHHFYMNRLQTINKVGMSDEDTYLDQPFLTSFFYQIVSVIGAGGSYSSQKMFEFLFSFMKSQTNPKILIMCRSLGLIENFSFNIDLQSKYLRYLQVLYELKEGIDVPINYESCRQ